MLAWMEEKEKERASISKQIDCQSRLDAALASVITTQSIHYHLLFL